MESRTLIENEVAYKDVIMRPVNVTAKKPGWKTTEFYLSLAATVTGALLASGVVIENKPLVNVLGLVSALLSTLGYTASRTIVKR